GEMALRDATEGTRLHRDVGSILTAGERGRSLVEQILIFSRSGANERIAVHVERVVREVLDQIAARLPRNIAIVPVLQAGHAAVRGDTTQVHQVVTNLVTNALQAMPAGGSIRVQLDTLRAAERRMLTTGMLQPGDYVVLEVADSGTGIAPDIL